MKLSNLFKKNDENIIIKDSFSFFINKNSDSIYKESLLIDINRIEKITNYINKRNIKSITINPYYFEKLNNLDFLKEIAHIEELKILQDDLIDIQGIEYLGEIKHLVFNGVLKNINFDKIRTLRFLSCAYSNRMINLETLLNLEILHLENYKETDLSQFKNCFLLKKISLVNTTISSLNGIQEFQHLQEIEIDRAPKLVTLKGVNEINDLKIIKIFNAKNLSDVEAINSAKKLEKLWLQKIGEINDFNFLKDLSCLNTLVIGTNVKNKNFEILMDIKNVFIPGYSKNTLK